MAFDDHNITTSALENVSDVIAQRSSSTSGDYVTHGNGNVDTSQAKMMMSLTNSAVGVAINLTNDDGNVNPGNDVTSTLSAWTTRAPTEAVTSLPVPMYVKPTHRLESTFTGWITDTENLSRLHGNYNLYVLYGTFGLMLLCFLLLVFWIQCKKRLMLLRYERLPVTVADQRETNFAYKPSNGDWLDEEYENTFVGVSIPILQDVTKL
ncbi:hypothetical protein LSH36_923g01030 [Paralvinella palmiformis]|uniref:Uncharacterized protein n=1 Tax=Paralvinella palmiformis TaxID=53620 RepID=A0AAD9IZ10_9ANNE|nr:hypothetical protein LSH36_923g01030 [Paralvinella palmiformis]